MVPSTFQQKSIYGSSARETEVIFETLNFFMTPQLMSGPPSLDLNGDSGMTLGTISATIALIAQNFLQ